MNRGAAFPTGDGHIRHRQLERGLRRAYRWYGSWRMILKAR